MMSDGWGDVQYKAFCKLPFRNEALIDIIYGRRPTISKILRTHCFLHSTFLPALIAKSPS